MKAQVLWMGLAASVALTACSSKLESRKTSVKKPAPIVTPDAPAEPSVEQKSAPGEVSPSNQVKFERNLEQGTWSTECGEISFWSRFSQNTARSVLKFEGGRVKLVESNYDWSNCTDLKEEKVLMDSLYYVELDAANPNLATIRTFHHEKGDIILVDQTFRLEMNGYDNMTVRTDKGESKFTRPIDPKQWVTW